MKVKPITEIKTLCDEVAISLGVKVVDVEFKQGKNPSLTIYIDKVGGMDLDTCELFHRAIDVPLDELDPTYGLPYSLNVSSPGVDRPFKTDEDYLSHVGKMVEVKFYASVKGKKMVDAELLSYDGKQVGLKIDGKHAVTVDLKNIVKMNEYIDF